MAVSEKNELLFSVAGVHFNDLPPWQKRGIGVYFETYTKAAADPVAGEGVEATRRRIKVDMELPMRDAYSRFIEGFVELAKR
jgi:tRNA(His) 5'-end guanylyltransferase